VADHQTRGRGRDGRIWHTAPGQGLALSILLTELPAGDTLPLLPLAAGLALARALDGTGAGVELKWPNDLLIGGGKVAGILCEGRTGGSGERAAVIGVGVNVTQRAHDFPVELEHATPPPTSLALHGVTTRRETVAAGFLGALEPLLESLIDRGAAPLLDAWRARARFWGQPVVVRTPQGPVAGIAESLDERGGLVIARPDGGRVHVMAGDLELTAIPEPERR
jgi:BirA family biotin operon repressor/biotin-[acetyl-CoA-carboxylase] ligase